MNALGYATTALTALSQSILFSGTHSTIRFLPKPVQSRTKVNKIQYDLLALSTTDDPTVMLSSLPITSLVYTSRRIESKAAEATLGLKIADVACEVLYQYEPVTTYKEFGVVKEWLVEFYQQLLSTTVNGLYFTASMRFS